MSQRQADFIQSCFGEQSLTALQAQLCEHLPLGCFGTKVNDPAVWQLLCYASLPSDQPSGCVVLASHQP